MKKKIVRTYTFVRDRECDVKLMPITFCKRFIFVLFVFCNN